MNLDILINLVVFTAFLTLVFSLCGLVLLFFVYVARRRKSHQRHAQNSVPVRRPSLSAPVKSFFTFSSDDDEEEEEEEEEPDITTFATKDIPRSGLFSASERRMEYRRRGKSPSGVIDGVYNDMNCEDGHSYNDMDRDWDADA